MHLNNNLPAWQVWPPIGQRWPPYNDRTWQAEGFIGWWPMGDGHLRDSAASYHGTLYNAPPQLIDDAFGKGISFNGSTQYGELPLAVYNSLASGPFTISFWYRCTGDPDSSDCLIGNNQNGVAGGMNIYINGVSGTEHRLEVNMDSGFGSILQGTDIAGAGNLTRLVHLTRSVANVFTLYFNGIQDVTAAGASHDISQARTCLIAAQHGGGGPERFSPIVMAELRIRNYALSPAQVLQEYDPSTRWDLHQVAAHLWDKAPAAVAAGWGQLLSGKRNRLVMR